MKRSSREADRLLRLKKSIERKKEEFQSCSGELKVYLKRLSDDFGCSDLDQAVKLLSRLKKEQKRKTLKAKELLDKVEEEYDLV